jgi:hypothetical protein
MSGFSFMLNIKPCYFKCTRARQKIWFMQYSVRNSSIYIEDLKRVHMAYEIYEMSYRIWYFPSLGEGNIQIR